MRCRWKAASGGEPLSPFENGGADIARVDLPVGSRDDVPAVARASRHYAHLAGFGREDAECVALAATELATNLARYAVHGRISLSLVHGSPGPVLQLESWDCGPGIPDIEQAMQDGFSTGGGLGSGLPGVRRLMDHFEVFSAAAGTHVLARKWSSGR